MIDFVLAYSVCFYSLKVCYGKKLISLAKKLLHESNWMKNDVEDIYKIMIYNIRMHFNK